MTATTALEERASRSGGADRLRAWARSPVGALIVLFAVVVVPFVQDDTAQPASRYSLTAALTDHGTIVLDRYEDVLGIDVAERDGRRYSDKAPGQPFLTVPFYAAARLVGTEPATVFRVEGKLGLWWVTLWSSTVPMLVLIALMAGASRRQPGGAVPAAAALAFGTLLLPFSSQLYAHVLAAALGFGAWRVVADHPSAARRALAAGVLAGTAVIVEYPTALVAVAVLGWLFVRRAWRSAVLFSAAMVPFALLLALYQWAAFGSPFRVSYRQKDVHAADSLIVGIPRPGRLVEVLLGSRGLFLFTPIVLLALIGTVLLARRGGPDRHHAVFGLVVFALFLLLQAGWSNPWGGEMPGPRYLISALPFLAVGLAHLWPRAPLFRRPVAIVSVLTMVLPLITLHLVPMGQTAVGTHLWNIRRYGLTNTVFTMALGPVGWAVHALVVGVAALAWWTALARSDRRPLPSRRAEEALSGL